MNENRTNQVMYLLARMLGYYVTLILVVWGTKLSVETMQITAFVAGVISVILDIVIHMRNKWNGISLLVAALISTFLVNFEDPFLAITGAMAFTIFLSPFVMILLPNPQEEKPAAA